MECTIISRVADFCNTIVIKVGSSSLTDRSGGLNFATINAITSQISYLLTSQDIRIVIVTSGAVAAGRGRLAQFNENPPSDVDRRITATARRAGWAAVGQISLMNAYQESLSEHGLVTAQLLLTSNELDKRDEFESVRQTLRELLWSSGRFPAPTVVPVINANDVINNGISENDNLAAAIAIMCGASHLLLLTDTKGLYTADPRVDPDARLVQDLSDNIDNALGFVSATSGTLGTGGMRSKLIAAITAANGGVDTTIARTDEPDVIARILRNDRTVGTHVGAVREALQEKDVFLGAVVRPRGKLLVHREAIRMLAHGQSSLLSVGIARVRIRDKYVSSFDSGSVVSLCGPDWREFGRGVVTTRSDSLRHICGLSAAQLDQLVRIEERQIESGRRILRQLVDNARTLLGRILDQTTVSSSKYYDSVRTSLQSQFPAYKGRALENEVIQKVVDRRSRLERDRTKLRAEVQVGHISTGHAEAKLLRAKSYVGAHEATLVAPIVATELARLVGQVKVDIVEKAIRGSGLRRGISPEQAMLVTMLIARIEPSSHQLIGHKVIKAFVQASPAERSIVRREASLLLRYSEARDGGFDDNSVSVALAPVVHRDRMVLYPTEVSAILAQIEESGQRPMRSKR